MLESISASSWNIKVDKKYYKFDQKETLTSFLAVWSRNPSPNKSSVASLSVLYIYIFVDIKVTL